MRAHRSRVASLAAFLLLGACADGIRPLAPDTDVGPRARFNGGAVSGPSVVISQVYGGGNNSGATYRNDFVELFNRGDAPATLTGLSVQYASATGSGNFSANGVVALTGTLAPGQYYLVQLAGGTSVGLPLPTPDATGTANMSGTAGKVVLVNGTTGLACNGSTSQPCTPAQLAQIVDLVGFGNANFFEGSSAVATLSNATAGLRRNGGCTDTGNNGNDFNTGTPAPRNTASQLTSCTPTQPAVVTSVTVTPATASVVAGGTTSLTAVARDASNNVVSGQTFTWLSSAPDVASVSDNGTVTALSAGEASITASVSTTNGPVTSTPAVITVTAPVGVPDVRVSELHYDNTGTDVNERIEIEGPAGTDLTGWRVILYNGGGGEGYDTRVLSGLIPATCGSRGVVVLDYPSNGIQNGPDGLALVDASNTVIEFLSYEGTFVATDGPAAGSTSVNMGVFEQSSPYGFSLQRNAAGTAWAAPAAATFGGCNGTGIAPPQPGFLDFFGRTPPGGSDGDPPLPAGF
ncbi:MAG: lamin tail domain-containing protein, partial [Gemmatimonadaceae bacterium]